MLDGLRLAEEGRRAGRTNSPDFFRSIGGFLGRRSSCSVSSSLSEGEDVRDGYVCALARSKWADGSVADLECEIFRASFDNGLSDLSVLVGSSDPSSLRPYTTLARLISSAFLSGEPSLRCSIRLTAVCSSARYCSFLSRPLTSACFSSSLEFCAESGGDMMAPVGMTRLLRGGGDCLKPLIFNTSSSLPSL